VKTLTTNPTSDNQPLETAGYRVLIIDREKPQDRWTYGSNVIHHPMNQLRIVAMDEKHCTPRSGRLILDTLV
jgi:hypothetical protein